MTDPAARRGSVLSRRRHLTPTDVRIRVLGARGGDASALRMCTVSVHKGTATLVAHALLTARRHGILDAVLAELETGDLLLGTDPA